MSINPHIMLAVSRERTADLMREAAAYRIASEARQAAKASEPATRQHLGQDASHELTPVTAEER